MIDLLVSAVQPYEPTRWLDVRPVAAAVTATGIIDTSDYPGTDGANMRAKPNGTVLVIVPNGERIHVLEQDGDWLLCRWNTYQGWIFERLVKH